MENNTSQQINNKTAVMDIKVPTTRPSIARLTTSSVVEKDQSKLKTLPLNSDSKESPLSGSSLSTGAYITIIITMVIMIVMISLVIFIYYQSKK